MVIDGVHVRQATAADIEAMVGLFHALFSIEADFRFDAVKQACGLSLLLSRAEDACLLVAEHAGSIVGMCSLQCLVSTAEGGRVGLIEDLVVAEGWRGRGIGRQLLEAMEGWARDHGLSRLQLLADSHNHPALDFYAALAWSGTRLQALRKYLHEG